MKKTHFYPGAFVAFLLAGTFFACDDDNEKWPSMDGKNPEFSIEKPVIGSRPGQTLHITGIVKDADGLSHITLECLPLYLDKRIDLLTIYGEAKETYDLDYKITSDLTEAGDKFEVLLSAFDVLGNSSSTTVTIDMNGDIEAPKFTVTPADEVTVVLADKAELDLSFTVTDDRALGSVSVEIPEINFSSTVTEFEDPTSYTFSRLIEFPARNAEYSINISATDLWNNVTETTTIVHVSDTPDFAKMWLADVATAAELNSDVMGVPMLISHTAPFEYEARYYNEKAGTEIFFLPQRNDFAPLCIGLDPADNTRIVSDPTAAKPFVLDIANTYYLIKFNTVKCTYSIETYSIAEAIDPIPHKFGSNELDRWKSGEEFIEFYFGYTTEGPENIVRFEQDAVNPHIYRLPEPLKLKAGRHSGFIIHNYHPDGWWNYCTWRADDEQDPEICGWYGEVTNPKWNGNRAEDKWFKPAIPADGEYNLIMDAHLDRMKIVPVKK